MDLRSSRRQWPDFWRMMCKWGAEHWPRAQPQQIQRSDRTRRLSGRDILARYYPREHFAIDVAAGQRDGAIRLPRLRLRSCSAPASGAAPAPSAVTCVALKYNRMAAATSSSVTATHARRPPDHVERRQIRHAAGHAVGESVLTACSIGFFASNDSLYAGACAETTPTISVFSPVHRGGNHRADAGALSNRDVNRRRSGTPREQFERIRRDAAHDIADETPESCAGRVRRQPCLHVRGFLKSLPCSSSRRRAHASRHSFP